MGRMVSLKLQLVSRFSQEEGWRWPRRRGSSKLILILKSFGLNGCRHGEHLQSITASRSSWKIIQEHGSNRKSSTLHEDLSTSLYESKNPRVHKSHESHDSHESTSPRFHKPLQGSISMSLKIPTSPTTPTTPTRLAPTTFAPPRISLRGWLAPRLST